MMRWKILFLSGCLWLPCLVACTNSTLPATSEAALRPIEGCEDLQAVLQARALEEMHQRLDQNLAWALEMGGRCWSLEGNAECSGGLCGTPNESGGGSEPGASEYSTTNVQEGGVDEADIVKNDGKYIYLLAGDGLRIFDAWPAPQTRLVSSTPVDGIPQGLYVHADHALVFSYLADRCEEAPSGTYCWSARPRIQITLFDITDRHQPVLERELALSGSYVSSRRIGRAVHSVVRFPPVGFPGLRYWPESIDGCGPFSTAEILVEFYLLRKQNESIIRQTSLSDWLPSIRDTLHLPGGATVTEGELLLDCRNFFEPSLPAAGGFLGVLSFDMTIQRGRSITTLVGNAGEVYASKEALYVAASHIRHPDRPWPYEAEGVQEITAVHKFALSSSPPSATYRGSGAVEGRVLNQFSMGEHEGFLRMATTTWREVRSNSVFVLGEQEGGLQTVGAITGIAPTEDIRSARFVGDRGFVVTFKKTDPLYALDLADPLHPRIAGELKIPGFSTYIHMMDADHLLTIGFDADDQGSFAWFQGIELQIFDVSDMADPRQTHKTIIGTRGSTSEATANHLAFNYFAPKDLLALPMAICVDSDGGGSYGTTLEFTGLMIWDVTVEAGFAERGRVDHPVPAEGGDGCSNWWTQPGSRVKRSIVMDDWVFSISDALLKVNHLDDLETDTQALAFPPVPRFSAWW